MVDDHQHEEVQHNEGADHYEGDEVDKPEHSPTIAVSIRLLAILGSRAIVHYLEPVLARGRSEQQHHRVAEIGEIGPLIDAVSSPDVLEHKDSEHGVNEKDQQKERADVDQRGQREDQRLQQILHFLEALHQLEESRDSQDSEDARQLRAHAQESHKAGAHQVHHQVEDRSEHHEEVKAVPPAEPVPGESQSEHLQEGLHDEDEGEGDVRVGQALLVVLRHPLVAQCHRPDVQNDDAQDEVVELIVLHQLEDPESQFVPRPAEADEIRLRLRYQLHQRNPVLLVLVQKQL